MVGGHGPHSDIRLRSTMTTRQHRKSCKTPTYYLGNDEYPRGFCGGKARTVHCLLPHFEHRSRFLSSSSRVSHPHKRPRACGSTVRSWPHAIHFNTKVYWPNSSLSLSIRKSRDIPGIVTRQSDGVHPVLETQKHCMRNSGPHISK